MRILVKDLSNNPRPNITITLYSNPVQAITDSSGIAKFTNVSPGKHVVIASLGTFDKSTPITVSESTIPQQFTLSVPNQTTQPIISKYLIYIIGLIVALLLIVFLLIFIKRKKNNGATVQPAPENTQPQSVSQNQYSYTPSST